MSRGDLSEAEWRILKGLLPPERVRKSRPASDNRPIINGILWRTRTGAPWRDVPEKKRMVVDSIPALQALAGRRHLGGSRDDPGPGDGRQPAPQHRQQDCPGPCIGSRRKRGTREQAFGRSRGRFNCKVHFLSDAAGIPLAFHLTGGEAADKGYDSAAIRDDLIERGIRLVIPPRSNRITPIRWNRRIYPKRNRIERMIGHL